MTAPDEQLLEANWARMRTALTRAATEYRRTADALEAIQFDGAAGVRRAPEAIISQAALSTNAGRIDADLIHRLAIWAETINDILQHQTITGHRVLCPYKAEDMSCVLTVGHGVPIDDGMVVHVTADGVTFL